MRKAISSRYVSIAIVLFVTLSVAALGQMQGAPPPEKTAVIYGQNIRYFEAGQGPTVVLLHGLGSVKEVWLPNIGALSAKYHVYAIDQIGFGHSDKPLLDYKIGTWVDSLQAFMQSQNISKATLVGNSLGGWIALDFAVQHPELVDKLVLVDAAGLTWGQSVPVVDLNPSSIPETRALLESLFYNKKMVSDEFVQNVFANHMRNNDGYTIQRTLAGFAQAPFEDQKLKSVRAPTLVIWGRQDELIGVDRAEKFNAGIAGSKLVIFDQCGHVPQIEKAEEFNKALLDFLAK
jgi:2-hydroxy-6-oxonona-2,4-dienedioate hydrolase